MLAPRRHPGGDPARRRSARPPTRRRAAARCRATGATPASTWSPSRARPGSQCLPAVGCAEAGRYISRRQLPGCAAHGDELTYVSLGEGATSEGEFWESLNTACTLAPAGAVRGGRQRLRHLGAVRRPGAGADLRAGAGLPGPARPPARRAGLLRGAVAGPPTSSPRSGPASGPALIHATVTRPVLALRRPDTQSKYRSPEELADEAAHDPIGAAGAGPGRRRGAHRRARSTAIREEARQTVLAAARRGARPRPGPTRPRSPTTSSALPAVAARGRGGRRRHRARWWRSARPSGAPCTSRWRTTSASGSSARTWPTPARPVLANVEGKGGVFGTTFGLQRQLRAGPLLQHPAGRGQHRRPGRRSGPAGPAAGARGAVLRLHLAGHAADQERGGHHPLALERRLHLPHGAAGARSAAT